MLGYFLMSSNKEIYSLERYFGNSIPNNVSQTLNIDGIRPLKSGSKFKVFGERGDFTFLYAQNNSITCFSSAGQFKVIPINKVKKTVNRSKREIKLSKTV